MMSDLSAAGSPAILAWVSRRSFSIGSEILCYAVAVASLLLQGFTMDRAIRWLYGPGQFRASAIIFPGASLICCRLEGIWQGRIGMAAMGRLC